MVVGAKWAGMSISEPDDILGFSSHNHLLGSQRERNYSASSSSLGENARTCCVVMWMGINYPSLTETPWYS